MLTAHDLAVGYRHRAVISGLELAPMPPGTITALLGPNGSGKSTLMRALAGLLPSRGEIRLEALRLDRLGLAERARHCAYLPQSLPPLVHLQAIEAVMAAIRATRGADRPGGAPKKIAVRDLLRLGKADEGLALKRALAMLERLGIGSLAVRYLDELSGGQRQLVGLAQALVRQPHLLLLDEPLSALDLRHQVRVMEVLRALTREAGMITVIVMHDLDAALHHADRAVLLRDGKILGQGAAGEVICPRLVREAYGVRARVETCSEGLSHVIVDGVA